MNNILHYVKKNIIRLRQDEITFNYTWPKYILKK